MSSPAFQVRRATVADLNGLVPLFDSYRRFYRLPGDPDGARRFLLDRLEHNESIILLALDGDGAIGFTQLFPSFSSGAMARIFILNDLFVAPEARRRGVGAALLREAAAFGRSAGAVRLVLSTEETNVAAKSVYERLGWRRDTTFCVYQLLL